MKAIKNELESFSYDMRNSIEQYGPLERYIDDQTRSTFLEEINQTVKWIYEEGQNASKEVYQQKLDHFKKIGLPIKERHRFYSEIEIYQTQFQ